MALQITGEVPLCPWFAWPWLPVEPIGACLWFWIVESRARPFFNFFFYIFVQFARITRIRVWSRPPPQTKIWDYTTFALPQNSILCVLIFFNRLLICKIETKRRNYHSIYVYVLIFFLQNNLWCFRHRLVAQQLNISQMPSRLERHPSQGVST